MGNQNIGMDRFIFLAILCIFALFFTFSSSAAAASLELQIEPGLGGQVKENKDIPVKLTVTNKGESIEGYLTVRYTGSSSEMIAISRSLSLPEGSTQEVWVTVPSRRYTDQDNEIVFTTKDPANGKQIPFVGGKKSLEISPIHAQTMQVGVFAANRDAFNFLNLVGGQTKVHPLDANRFAVELLEQLNVLAVNDYAGEQFTADELRAIERWIYRGGTLILSGGAGYTKIGEQLLSLSPVQFNGTETVKSLDSLVQFTEQPLQSNASVTFVRGEVVNGQALLLQNELPIFAQADVGQGQVLFVAYDVSLEPLASWSGNRVLWERLLQDALAKANAEHQYRGNMYWELDRALNYFPQLKSPAFGWMALLFFIYILIVGPILYFLLKRVDKRGWAWFIIPSISLVFSLVIYVVGAWDRNETLAQHLEFVELYGDGTGHRSAAASYFVPRGGAYTVTYDSTQKISSFSDRTSPYGSYDFSNSIDELITVDSVRFYKVPFWSIRKTWLEDRELGTYGDLTYDLRFEEGAIVGEVTNDTNADLEDVWMIYRHTYEKIGSLAKGETKTIRLPYHVQPRAHYRNIGYDLFGQQSITDEQRHKRSMVIAMFQREMPSLSIIGFSKSQRPVQIEDEQVVADIVTLWFKEAELSFASDERIHIPFGSITPHVTSFDDKGSGQPYSIQDGLIAMGVGELDLAYPLPTIEHANYETLVVSYGLPQQVTLSIWNETLSAWEPLEREGSTATYSDVNHYMDRGNIRLKIEHSQEYNEFQLPEIMLEGRTTDD